MGKTVDLNDLMAGMKKLSKDASKLALDVTIFTKRKEAGWRRILEIAKDKKLVVKNRKDEVLGYNFQVSIINEVLSISFVSGFSLSINLKTGEIINATDRDVLWVLNLAHQFFEPMFWENYIKSL